MPHAHDEVAPMPRHLLDVVFCDLKDLFHEVLDPGPGGIGVEEIGLILPVPSPQQLVAVSVARTEVEIDTDALAASLAHELRADKG